MATPQPLVPADKFGLLASTALAHVATIGPRGEPQVNPVWFHWDGARIHFAMTRGAQKYRNLRRDSRVALSIVEPANPGRYLEIRGHATFASDPDAAFINLLAKKYMGLDTHPEPTLDWVVVAIEPEHISQMG
jgi:PPOX class probable F420-dependent enzyme